ncbi:MAG: SRPBCC family protein [Telluria sp.]
MLYRIVTLTALALGGALLAKQIKHARSGDSGSSVIEDIDVNVPVRVAYDQFTQFETFPRFMQSVHEVRRLDDKRLHWRASILGKELTWDAEITEQIPDSIIAWRSTSGTPNGGTVSFRSLSRSRTRITLEMYYEPHDGMEMAGDALGAVRLEARGNLKNFKEMIELRGQETGAWRGTIQPPSGPNSSR